MRWFAVGLLGALLAAGCLQPGETAAPTEAPRDAGPVTPLIPHLSAAICTTKAHGSSRVGLRPLPSPGLAAATKDWDNDGVPDSLDALNAPGEATQWSRSDSWSFPQGLRPSSFALLAEPHQQEAILVLAGDLPRPEQGGWTAGNDSAAPAELDVFGEQALELMSHRWCAPLAESLRPLLRPDVLIHVRQVVPGTPVRMPLEWVAAVPSDGTWILVRGGLPLPTDLNLSAGGRHWPAADAVAPDIDGAIGVQWDLIHLDDVQRDFCYAEATYADEAPCYGVSRQDIERLYSSDALTTYRVVHGELANGTWPVTFCLPQAAEACLAPPPANVTPVPSPAPPKPLAVKGFQLVEVGATWATFEWNATGDGADQLNVRFEGRARCMCPPKPTLANGTYKVTVRSLAADEQFEAHLSRWGFDAQGRWRQIDVTDAFAFRTLDDVKGVPFFDPAVYANGNCIGYEATVTGPGMLRPTVVFESMEGQYVLGTWLPNTEGDFSVGECNPPYPSMFHVTIHVENDRGESWDGPDREVFASGT